MAHPPPYGVASGRLGRRTHPRRRPCPGAPRPPPRRRPGARPGRTTSAPPADGVRSPGSRARGCACRRPPHLSALRPPGPPPAAAPARARAPHPPRSPPGPTPRLPGGVRRTADRLQPRQVGPSSTGHQVTALRRTADQRCGQLGERPGVRFVQHPGPGSVSTGTRARAPDNVRTSARGRTRSASTSTGPGQLRYSPRNPPEGSCSAISAVGSPGSSRASPASADGSRSPATAHTSRCAAEEARSTGKAGCSGARRPVFRCRNRPASVSASARACATLPTGVTNPRPARTPTATARSAASRPCPAPGDPPGPEATNRTCPSGSSAALTTSARRPARFNARAAARTSALSGCAPRTRVRLRASAAPAAPGRSATAPSHGPAPPVASPPERSTSRS